MTFHGLFVGIDKYKPPINRLSCAVADAQALGGLFADTFDGHHIKTMLDGDATQASLREALATWRRVLKTISWLSASRVTALMTTG